MMRLDCWMGHLGRYPQWFGLQDAAEVDSLHLVGALILLVEEILHHQGCIWSCKSWDKLPTSTGLQDFFHQQYWCTWYEVTRIQDTYHDLDVGKNHSNLFILPRKELSLKDRMLRDYNPTIRRMEIHRFLGIQISEYFGKAPNTPNSN